ncbi:glycosyltransferase [Verrucomicrobiota bacterium]
MDIKNGTATFVMPHWLNGDEQSRKYLDEAIKSLFEQTDSNWQLVIVDDLSPSEQAKDYLKQLSEKHPDKIHVIFKETNDGPGYCRNIGIDWAHEHDSPFVLYNDADDDSDPKRVETARKIFMEDPEASVIYSTIKIIDENSELVPEEKLTPSIVEIIESHKHNPPQGLNAWIEIGTDKGYTNLTSATAVRTEIAKAYPFPPEKVSEDSHTWMRYSAGGGKFVYTPETPTLYRIPQDTAGSASRSREGGKHGFYVTKARVDTDGFQEAVRLALENGKLDPADKDTVLIGFYVKLGETMAKEQEMDIASEQITCAIKLSQEKTQQALAKRGLQDADWASI